MLVAGDQLAPIDIATTVRVRDGETEITDGPFATTKEILAGYYMLDCADLDEALKRAARSPLAALRLGRGAADPGDEARPKRSTRGRGPRASRR